MKNVSISRRGLIAGAALAFAAPKLALGAGQGPAGAAKRIIAIGAPITEILFGLGCGDRIVAVDATSRFPSAARRKGDAGQHDDLSVDALLAHAPDLVVTGENAGPREAIEALAAASVKVVALKDVRRPADIHERIRTAGVAIGDPARGAALADAVAEDLASVASDLGRIGARRRTLVLLGLGSAHPLIVAGAGTSASLALEMAGADNAGDRFTGWKVVKDAVVADLNPDAIVAISMSAPLLAADVSAHPALRDTPAGRENRVVVVDGVAFAGFGPRAAHVTASVARTVYPEAGIRQLLKRSWVEESVASL